MNNIDFSKYKFRASSLGKIMTDGRKKGELSETTKTYLLSIWIKQVYGRERDYSNKYMEKGNYAELTDSLDIISEYYKKPFTSKDLNKAEVENEFMTGHIDINKLEDRVIDIKSSWDMQTFFEADGSNKDYFWQGWSYMWMTGKKQFDLAYCLSNASDWQIENEHKKKMYNFKEFEGTEEYQGLFDYWWDFFQKNMKFDDVPMSERIRVFSQEFDESRVEKVIKRIEQCREYLQNLKP